MPQNSTATLACGGAINVKEIQSSEWTIIDVKLRVVELSGPAEVSSRYVGRGTSRCLMVSNQTWKTLTVRSHLAPARNDGRCCG